MKKSNFLRASLVTLILSLLISGAMAADRTWNGGSSTDNNWSSAANWGGTAPVNNDNLIFSGTTRQNTTNDISNLTTAWLRFANDGFSLNGNSFTLNPPAGGIFTNLAGTNIINNNLTITPAARYWAISPNSELRLTGIVTNTSVGGTSSGWLCLTNGGTVRINNTAKSTRGMDLFQGTVIVDGGLVDAINDGIRFKPPTGSTITVVLTNNGTLRIGGGGNFRMGHNGTVIGAAAGPGSTSIMNMYSGTLELYGANVSVLAGDQIAGAKGIFNQNGGLVWGSAGTGNTVTIGGVANADGTYNLNGGVLWVGQVRQGNAGATNVVFNFNGGTLKPFTNSTTFFQGLLTANVQNGGAVIDTTNYTINIAQNLLAAGTGGLKKLGTGTLILSGTSTYTGTTVVSNGTLAITSGNVTGGGALQVADGAVLSVTNSGATHSASSLTMGSTGTSTLRFTFPSGNAGSPTIVATSITGNGNAVISISGQNFTAGQFPLIQYTTASGLPNFHLGSVPGGVSATLGTNATSIYLNITAVVKSIAWTGAADNQWNTSSTDWIDLLNGNNPTNYSQSGGFGDMVTFDDAATGSTAIDVPIAVTPVSMTFNNYGFNYSFTGAGRLSGAASLTKNGTQPLTLGTSNDFSGGTLLTAGPIYVGANQALGQGAVSITSGTIASDSGTPRSLSNSIILGADPNITLGDSVNNGTLTIGGTLDFGGSLTRVLNFNSDVVLTGSSGNGGIGTKTGLGRLIYRGQGQQAGLVNHQQGDVIIDGGRLDAANGWRMENTVASSILRFVVTNGGIFTIILDSANFRVGLSGGDNSATNILDISGIIALASATGNGRVDLGQSGAADIVNLRSGGRLTCRSLTSTAPASTEVDFYGGTLSPITDEPSFLQGLNYAFIQDGGVTVDTTNFNITIAQPLLAAGNGGLTKTGSGTLTLSGANTYAGPTFVNIGKLVLGLAHAATGGVAVATNATLSFLSSSPGVTVSVAGVTNADGASLEVQFLGLTNNPAAPAGTITNLVLSGTVGVNLLASNIKIGQFPLFGYGTISGGGRLSTTQLPQGVAGTIITNTGAKTIDLVVSSVTPLTWIGATNGNWDTTTTNWRVSGISVNFHQGDSVRFDDSASNSAVTLTLALTPGAVTVSNRSLAYQIGFTGSGSLGGSMGLVKDGTNTLSLNSPNTFVGSVTVKAGTLIAGNATALGATNGSTTVLSGATLDTGGVNLGLEPVLVGGTGAGGQGALINTGGGQNNSLRDVTLTADTIIRTDALLGIRTSADDDPGFRGNGFKLTKTGTDQLNLNGGQSNPGATIWESDLGDIDILQGALSFQRRMTMGRPTNTLTVASGATLLLFALNTSMPVQEKIVHLNNATLTGNGNNNTEGSTFGGPITLGTGTNFIGALTGTTLRLIGPIDGPGNLFANSGGAATVMLAGTNTHTGDTEIQTGTLALDSTALLATTPSIRVDTGATFDVSAFGQWPLSANQTLSGNGTINGTVLANGTVAPGSSIGALTFNSNLTLAGTNVMEVTKDGGLTNDVITVSGTLTYGSVLKVVLIGTTPLAVNDTVKLFNFGSAPSGTFTSFILPSGYTWDTSQLSPSGDGTIKVTAVTARPHPGFTTVTVSGGSVIIGGTNAVGTYVLLSSTNVALPVASWTREATNSYSGVFTITNTMNAPQKFYLLQ